MALNKALRGVLPVFRTTPSAVLGRETGIPNAVELLEGFRWAAAARLRQIPASHPLWSRWCRRGRDRYDTPLFRLFRLPPGKPAAQPDPGPVYEDQGEIERQVMALHPRPAPAENDTPPPGPAEHCSRPEPSPAERHAEFLRTRGPGDVLVYSDGSRLADGRTGAGWAVAQYTPAPAPPGWDVSVRTGGIPLGTHREVFDAEAKAALEGPI